MIYFTRYVDCKSINMLFNKVCMSDDIIFKRAAVLMTCAIKDATKSHPELFLYHALYEEKRKQNAKHLKNI